jgi:hypothetical protein
VIEEHLYNDHIASGYKNLTIRQVYEDEHVEVFQLEQSEIHDLDQDNPINQLVPGTRCYRVGGRTDNNTVARRPKYNDRVLQLCYPIAWFRPKNPNWDGEIYEMGDKGFISGHGELAEAITNQSISIYQLRKSRPELSVVFDLAEVKNTVGKITAPGAHIKPALMPEAFAKFLILFADRTGKNLSNEMFDLSFSYAVHSRVCSMLDIPNRMNDDYRNLIPFVLSDEIYRKYQNLLDQLIPALTIETFDLRIERTELVKQITANWLKNTSFHKISHKILADNAVIYNKLVAYEFAQVIVKEVDETIKEIIKQYEEQ